MKKTLILFLLISSTFSFLFASKGEPTRVACIGNSITYGAEIVDRTKTYPVILGNLLGKRYDVRNFGVSGANNLHKSEMPYIGLQAYRDALAFNPDIVIIKLGTNDSKPHNWDANKDDFKSDLIALIDSFRALPSNPKIILCLPAKAYNFNFRIRDEVIQHEIIPIIKQVAEEKSYYLIDLYQITSNMPENFPDGIHPNEKGAEVIAEAVFNAIKTNTKIKL